MGPMLHINPGLAPMVEVALAQIESEVSRCGFTICGLYHAHDNLRDNHVDVFSQKIADKIADNISGAIVATLDSKKLSLDIDTHALIVQQHDQQYYILQCYHLMLRTLCSLLHYIPIIMAK